MVNMCKAVSSNLFCIYLWLNSRVHRNTRPKNCSLSLVKFLGSEKSRVHKYTKGMPWLKAWGGYPRGTPLMGFVGRNFPRGRVGANFSTWACLVPKVPFRLRPGESGSLIFTGWPIVQTNGLRIGNQSMFRCWNLSLWRKEVYRFQCFVLSLFVCML